jgi:diguanylate cyclase (GGDEF)-like protein
MPRVHPPDDADVTAVTQLPPELLFDAVPQDKQGTLTVLLGSSVGATFALGSNALLIGRNPRAHVALDDDQASRNHARILRRGKTYEIEDMGSTNGTFVAGVRVVGRVELVDGDRVQIGHTLLRFALQDQIELEAGKRVYEASVRDGLTGAFNRRYFEERLVGEFAFAARHGTALCVLFADIDHFKRVNDRWGHPAGDKVLRHIGAALRTTLRAEDMIARYGGEEFAVLARAIDVAGARILAERLRSLVERTPVPWEGEMIAVTLSIGFAHNHSGAATADPQRMVMAADTALYAAKRAGRNRVELALSPGRYSVVRSDRPGARSSAPGASPRNWDKSTAPTDDTRNSLLPPGASRRPPKPSKD